LPGSPAGQAGLVGVDDRLDAVAESELGEYPSEVGRDRGLGDEEPLGDLGVGEAAGEFGQDLPFAGGEPAELGV
jgi:hypothetical protein